MVDERPQSWVFYFYNDTGATFPQDHFILDDVIYQFGQVIDNGGILDETHGLIDCSPGRVVQTDQITAGLTGLLMGQPFYMAPGGGLLHVVPVEGDWLVGKLYENQGSNNEIHLQTIIPIPYADLVT